MGTNLYISYVLFFNNVSVKSNVCPGALYLVTYLEKYSRSWRILSSRTTLAFNRVFSLILFRQLYRYLVSWYGWSARWVSTTKMIRYKSLGKYTCFLFLLGNTKMDFDNKDVFYFHNVLFALTHLRQISNKMFNKN